MDAPQPPQRGPRQAFRHLCAQERQRPLDPREGQLPRARGDGHGVDNI